jgi:hypothetical protein
METMRKFKVGDNIVRITDAVYGQRTGFKAIVDANYCYKSPNSVRCKIIDENWELTKPKWTIYNNEKPWEDLSNKQKGKLLLAAHNGSSFGGTDKTEFNNPDYAYKAKPELTMAELFVNDWMECSTGDPQTFADKIIARGWNKPCK